MTATTPAKVLQQLRAYLKAEKFGDWKSTAKRAQKALAAAGREDAAEMIGSYLGHLEDDHTARTYGSRFDTLTNNVRAVVNNLETMLNPPTEDNDD